MNKLVSIAIANMAALAAGCSVTTPLLGHDASETQTYVAAMPACGIAGDARVIAAQTRARSGLEAVSLNNRLAIGYAVDPTHAVAVDLDPGSLTFAGRSERQSAAPIDRVTPVESSNRGIGCTVDVDGRGDRVNGARTVTAATPFVVGAAGGHLVWSENQIGDLHELWSIDPQPIDSLRITSLGSKEGYAVAFRQRERIHLGAFFPDRTVKGPLVTLAATHATGALTLAASDQTVMVAWIASTADTTASIASSRWIPGQQPTEPRAFALRSRGEAFAPSLAGIGGGRFLLTYTNREHFDSRVMGQSIDEIGASFGAPFTVSAGLPGAAWGSTAVGDDGRGVVAFLAASDAGFQLVVTPIACRMLAPAGGATLAMK